MTKRILNALRAENIMEETEDLPSPIAVVQGQNEPAETRIFPTREGPVAVKIPRSIEDGVELAKKLMTEGGHKTMLPSSGPDDDNRLFIFRDGFWIKKVFSKLRLLGPSEKRELPLPQAVYTGIAGFSRLYQISCNGGTYLAKFDRADRLEKEWEAISRLREDGVLPPEIQKPLEANLPKHGIIVSPLFHGKVTSGIALQLDDYVEQQLLTNPENVHSALELLYSFLQNLYKSGSQEFYGHSWHTLYSLETNWTERSTKIAESLSRVEFEGDKICFRPNDLWLRNPLTEALHALREPVPRMFKAKTHGDLQSTNVLVALTPNRAPESLGIIDVEKMAPDRPVVMELVRVEADFWRTIFSKIIRSTFKSEAEQIDKALEIMTYVHRVLDSSQPRRVLSCSVSEDVANKVGCYVAALRKRSWMLLRKPGDEHYFPDTYMTALLLYYVHAIQTPLVSNDELRLRIVTLGASFAAQAKDDINKGIMEI